MPDFSWPGIAMALHCHVAAIIMGCFISSIVVDYQRLETGLNRNVAKQYAKLKKYVDCEEMTAEDAAAALKDVQETNWPEREGYEMVKKMQEMQTRINAHCCRCFVDPISLDVGMNEKTRSALVQKRDEVITYLEQISGDDEDARKEAMKKRPKISVADATTPQAAALPPPAKADANADVIAAFLKNNPVMITQILKILKPLAGGQGAAVGSANAPVGSANAPVGSANAPVGSANAPVGSANAPVGSANAPVGSANAPVGSGNAPVGSANAPVGSA